MDTLLSPGLRTAGWLLAIALTVAVSGCTLKVKLVGEYDEITDRSVTELQKSTHRFFAKLKQAGAEETGYAANRRFYDEVQVEISALILRAQVIEEGLKRNPLSKNFQALQQQYVDLAELHQKNPSPQILSSMEKAFEQSFRAILMHLLYLKWNQPQYANP